MIWRDQSGVTLVELAVVLVVIAALAAAVYPLLDNALLVLTSKGASEQVAGAIRQARQYAITRGSNHCIQFGATPFTSYTIRTAADNANCDGVTPIASETIANGAAVVSPNNLAIIFDPVGNVRLPTTTPVSVGVDTTPPSCLSSVLVTLYGGVRVSKC